MRHIPWSAPHAFLIVLTHVSLALPPLRSRSRVQNGVPLKSADGRPVHVHFVIEMNAYER